MKSTAFFLAVLFMALCSLNALGQGGWRQWDIYLVDGTKKQASPLAIDQQGRFTYSMGKEPGIERAKISYIAAVADNLPEAPTGSTSRDLVVKVDGARSYGRVTFENIKFSEGKIRQGGKEIDLHDVAYIKFAGSKIPKKRPK